MRIVVMNNKNFVATHPRSVVQYTMKCETTTEIYSVRKLNTLIYVYYVIFLDLMFSLYTENFCFILFVSRTFRCISEQISLRD